MGGSVFFLNSSTSARLRIILMVPAWFIYQQLIRTHFQNDENEDKWSNYWSFRTAFGAMPLPVPCSAALKQHGERCPRIYAQNLLHPHCKITQYFTFLQHSSQQHLCMH